MALDIHARFDFFLGTVTDVLLQFEAAALPEQTIISCDTQLCVSEHVARVPAQDSIGERVWLRMQGQCEIAYTARVEVNRMLADIATLDALPPHHLPGETIEYVFDSRYCAAERMHGFVNSEFGHLSGGQRIAAIRDWIANKITYSPGSSNAETTALDTFADRHGICRDFAHLLITFARASGIPARYVSCFAPGVTPQDFHAVAEVFLADPTIAGGGAWHIVDATGMADPAQTVKIGIGRDAADVSFMTTFGMAQFGNKEVSVSATT